MFGWSLFGTSFKNSDSKDFTCNPVNTSEEDKIHEMVENFWAQENYGIAPERDMGMSKQDKEAELKLNSHTKMVDGKYEIPMLWKDGTVTLPSNLSQATKRLEFLVKRFKADPDLYQNYKETYPSTWKWAMPE